MPSPPRFPPRAAGGLGAGELSAHLQPGSHERQRSVSAGAELRPDSPGWGGTIPPAQQISLYYCWFCLLAFTPFPFPSSPESAMLSPVKHKARRGETHGAPRSPPASAAAETPSQPRAALLGVFSAKTTNVHPRGPSRRGLEGVGVGGGALDSGASGRVSAPAARRSQLTVPG